MNRNEEYWSLIGSLGDAPPELEGTVARAKARAKKTRARRWLGIPVASLGGVAAAFVLLVNCSMPFAMACRRLPLVRELAEAVAFEPSLRAAMENDYIQYVGQTRTVDGITMTVEYLIADETELNVFYTLRSEGETALDASPTLLDADGERLSGYSAHTGFPGQRDEQDYLTSTFYFKEISLPETLRLRFEVRDSGRLKENGQLAGSPEAPTAAPSDGPWHGDGASSPPATLATFDFDLTLDPVTPARSAAVDRWLELDGQRVYLDALTVHPTRLFLTLTQDPANTAELYSLDCYAEDELGNRYGRPSVTYGGGEEIQLESPYFSGSSRLTLFIERVQWLDKDKTSFTLNLVTGEADWLPEGVSIESVERKGDDVYLAVKIDDHAAQLHWNYHDPEGGEHEWGGYSTSSTDRDGDGYCEEAVDYRILRDYPWDTVTIDLSANRATEFPDPVAVPIR